MPFLVLFFSWGKIFWPLVTSLCKIVAEIIDFTTRINPNRHRPNEAMNWIPSNVCSISFNRPIIVFTATVLVWTFWRVLGLSPIIHTTNADPFQIGYHFPVDRRKLVSVWIFRNKLRNMLGSSNTLKKKNKQTKTKTTPPKKPLSIMLEKWIRLISWNQTKNWRPGLRHSLKTPVYRFINFSRLLPSKSLCIGIVF